MARKSKNTEALVANMVESVTDEALLDALEAATTEVVSDPELEQALNEGWTPEEEEDTIVDIVQAIAEANGAGEILAQAQDAAAAQAPAVEETADEDEPVTDYATLVAGVGAVEVAQMQADLTAAFANRAAYERSENPNNDNIQKTLSKVQKGHLAYGISQGLRAIGMDPDYLNKSEVSGKRRNVYALEKLQDLIYGANTGHVKNAINRAVLASMVKLEAAGVPFTGAVAKACASDKIAVDGTLKALLVRHTVSESTASTQSSSTMTALEDLGAVINHGTQKHPIWTFAPTPIGQRLREMTVSTIMPAVAAA